MSSATANLADLHQQLERRGAAPLYTQLADLVRAQIRAGKLRPGDAIQPQRELSALWNVSEVTVRRALQALASEGLLEARAGSGTVVASSPRSAGAADTAAPAQRRLRIGIVSADLADGYPFNALMMDRLRSFDSDSVAFQFFKITSDRHDASLPLAELDGVLLMSPVNLHVVAACQAADKPYVLVYNHIADGMSRCIVVDYTSGILQAINHLVAKGRRRIAMVTALESRFSTGQMSDAYHAVLQMHHLPADPRWLIHAGYQEVQGYEAVKRLLACETRPDAILFASDYQARGGMIAIQEAGLSVPADIAVIGAGRLLREKEWPVPLTSIDLHIGQIGTVAIEAIRGLIDDPASVPYRQVIPSNLVSGETA